jgi:hypothetical protein
LGGSQVKSHGLRSLSWRLRATYFFAAFGGTTAGAGSVAAGGVAVKWDGAGGAGATAGTGAELSGRATTACALKAGAL